MPNTHQFYLMATLPTAFRDVFEDNPRFHLAMLGGYIGEYATTKIEFISAGFEYFDTFKERVRSLMPPVSLDCHDCKIIGELTDYLMRFKSVNREKYAMLLSEHWDKKGAKSWSAWSTLD